jgi:hypothetical protein
MAVTDQAFFEIVKTNVLLELGAPGIDLSGESTALDSALLIGFQRAMNLITQYRPKGRVHDVTFQAGVLEIDPVDYRIFSPDDIFGIYPRQMGLSFPVVYPRALGLAGISGQAALGTALVALSTLRTMYQAFALWPSWSIYIVGDPTATIPIVKYRIVLEPSISERATMIVRETWKDVDITKLLERQFGLTQLEREWIYDFTKMVVERHYARLRGRFSETLPLGPLELVQDHSSLLEDVRTKETEMIQKLLDFTAPPLPFFG